MEYLRIARADTASFSNATEEPSSRLPKRWPSTFGASGAGEFHLRASLEPDVSH